MANLVDLPNIGKILEEQLKQVNITTPEELKKAGSKEAWTRIKRIDASACYNRLCALEGAIRGIRWHDLAPEVKQELKEFYQIFK